MMKTISLMMAAIAPSAMASRTEIPSDGHFFYMVAHAGTNAPGVNGYDVTAGAVLVNNVAISASEQYFRLTDKANSDWVSHTDYDPTTSN